MGIIFRLIWFLVVGLAAGWLAGKIMRGKGFGFAGNMFVGVVGAFFGGLLFRILGLSAHGTIGFVVMATAGAIVLLLLVNWLRRH